MKMYKKIGAGAVILVTALVVSIGLKHPALADVASSDIQNASYTYQDRGNIIGDFGGSGKVTFTDANPLDSTRNYAPSQGGFCNPGNIPDQNGIKGDISFGINIASSASLTAANIPAQIKLGYSIGNNCTGVLEKASITNPQSPVPVAAATFQWDGQTIATFGGQQNNATYTKTTTKNNTDLYFSNNPAGNCPQDGAILLTSDNNHALYYVLSSITISPRGYFPGQNNLSDYKQLNDTEAVDASKCHVDSVSNITISGSQDQQPANGPGTTPSSGDPNSSCEANAGSPLAWLMCPLFSAASAIVQSTVNIFESLLTFTVAQDLGNASCQINNQGCQASVKLTWSIIKNIASIIIVIIMLIMIFSQAVGGGPFDAYTVRKMLPKLVAAVIVMQLSWPLLAWVIDLFNDLGKGLQDFLFAPFGGVNSLNDIGKLIHHAGIGPAGAAAFNWVAILAVGVATAAALPTALFLGFASIVGLLVGIITLIFRKILIIMLLVLSPVAIVAWILPGTERYWKLWYDNFLKALAMFPLIVAMIAAGRIFAYIAGPQTGFSGFTGAFLSLLFVLVGFIGPLFILPRTYKWGGSIMAAAGGAAHNVGASLNKRAEEPIKGWTKRQVQGRFAKQYKPKGSPGSTWLNRTATSLAGGRVLPTRYRAAVLTQSGDKWNDERDAEAQALLKRKGEIAMRDGYKAAVLTDDKRHFAKYRMDENGNYLNDKNEVQYRREADGTYTDIETGQRNVTDFGDEVKQRVDTFDEADKRTLTGVQAMKQMWVDIADESDNSHERKMAVRQLTATSSWPEIQSSLSRAGNKVIDTDAWNSSITTSPEEYPRVLRSRVDATPHIDTIAKKQLQDEKERGRTFTKNEEKDYIASRRVEYAVAQQMSNEDLQTQSDGFWEEVNRVANLKDQKGQYTQEAKAVQEALQGRLMDIRAIGGTGPQQLLGHLVGGTVEKSVNGALAGTNTTIRDYIPTSASAKTPSGGGPNPAPPSGGGEPGMSDGAEVDLHPDE